MSRRGTVQILCPGGLISIRFLRELAGHCNHFGARGLYVGPRQSLLAFFPSNEQARAFQERYPGESRIASPELPNIMSSAAGHESHSGWLSESRYREVLDELSPRLKRTVSLVDSACGVHARFADELNFIASETPRHWHLVLRGKRSGDQYALPFLLPSNRLAWVIETSGEGPLDPAEFEGRVRRELGFVLPVAPSLPAPRTREDDFVPEGFHSYGEGYAWLGLFNRHHMYSCLFLDELCYLCRRGDIAGIHLTPEHGLVVNKIPGDRVAQWKRFMSKHGFNLRHGSAALNWRVSEPELVGLKNSIIKKLVEAEVGTGDLSFAISTDYEFEESAVALQPVRGLWGRRSFNLFHRADFDPRSPRWFQAGANLRERDLASALIRLCVLYTNSFALELEEDARAAVEKRLEEPVMETGTEPGQYECPECLTRYVPVAGDPSVGIEPGTPYAELPDDYNCFTCDESAAHFRQVLPGRIAS